MKRFGRTARGVIDANRDQDDVGGRLPRRTAKKRGGYLNVDGAPAGVDERVRGD
jgi:hypothetical protein